jgi:hypothetical protein
MKHLLILAVSFCLVLSLQAQEKMDTKMSKSMKKDCMMMKDGKMMVMKDGKTMMMDHDMTCSDGTMVMADGNMKKKDGKMMMMKNGDCVTMDGKMTHMPMKKKMKMKM